MKARHGMTGAMLAVLLLTVGLIADEKEDPLRKQKETAEANWKRLEISKPAPPVESAHLIVYSDYPETRTKALSTAAERYYAAAAKALKYGTKDKPWPGKLAVYVISDRTLFNRFIRGVAKRSPEGEEFAIITITGDTPHLAVGPMRGEKLPSDSVVMSQIATALLKAKVGGAGAMPDWVMNGFAEATSYRAGNSSTRPNPKWAKAVANVPLSSLWGDELSAEAKLIVGAFIVDYLAYGPGNERFADFVKALRPGENGMLPPDKDILAAARLDEETLEYRAKKWIKPVTPKTPEPKKKK
jgi:hypothetical protein